MLGLFYLNMDITEDMWGPITEPDLERSPTLAPLLVTLSQESWGLAAMDMIDEPKQPVGSSPAMRGTAILLMDTMAKLVVDEVLLSIL